MLVIDGSRMEGGGQIVRSAVSLSALSGIPVTVTNIRAGRPRPGLAHQHLAAVRAVAMVSAATFSGLAVGSRTLEFSPGRIDDREITVDVGTAGSIPLVLQAWLPCALRAGGTITVTGGTEVDRSPTIDYYDGVFGRVLRDAGADMTVDVQERGYYPRGGGRVRVQVRQSVLSPVIPCGPRDSCTVCSCSSGLPDHVARRQADAAAAALGNAFPGGVNIRIDRRGGPGTGSSCTVWSGSFGASSLGKRGIPAETVGRRAAGDLITALEGGGTVDVHLSDQLLLYVAMAGGAIAAGSLSSHAATHLWLLEQFGYRLGICPGPPVEFSA